MSERNGFDIQTYMTEGVERVVRDALRATLKDPAETAFLMRFAAASKKASKKRAGAEKSGEHIPPFLIASITSACNLHCEGCYSRFNHATSDDSPVAQLSGQEWDKIFNEADELGISFILLAGGEPLLRRDVIEAAAAHQDILFPIFTNGVHMDQNYISLFVRNRNLVPIMSIEGGEEATDQRRGSGIYKKLIENMEVLHSRNILWGASLTVTSDNIDEIVSEDFLKGLSAKGCKAVIYVEFVPVTEDGRHLALNEKQQSFLQRRVSELRDSMQEIVFISFPGDEKSSDGCVAAGRGFFHINSHGGAEPCPFSPYSDISVRDTSIREALRSELFRQLNEQGLLKDDHVGGCTLFARREQVEKILAETK